MFSQPQTQTPGQIAHTHSCRGPCSCCPSLWDTHIVGFDLATEKKASAPSVTARVGLERTPLGEGSGQRKTSALWRCSHVGSNKRTEQMHRTGTGSLRESRRTEQKRGNPQPGTTAWQGRDRSGWGWRGVRGRRGGKGGEGQVPEHGHVHVCRHSVTVVASMRYPLHRRQVMWAFMSQSLIFLVNIFGFCKRMHRN